MHYDLVDLKVVLAVAEERNLSRGAARCNLSPSSASLRLKAMEASLGTELFVRRPRGVEVTSAGYVMIEHVRRCLAQLEQMHADLTPFANGIKGHITVFANMPRAIPPGLPRMPSPHALPGLSEARTVEGAGRRRHREPSGGVVGKPIGTSRFRASDLRQRRWEAPGAHRGRHPNSRVFKREE